MKRQDVKSRCPINFTVEVFGDAWSLLIVREIATHGKSRFSDFLDTEERIGSSVLAERLAHLEKKGIISKKPDPTDGRKMVYRFTPEGLNALPILYEVAVWGTHTSPNPKADAAWFRAMELDKDVVLTAWRSALESGDSFYTGPSSVVRQLDLL